MRKPRPPIRVCLLGSEAAGKTCFLAGLGVLAEPSRHSPIHTHGLDSTTVAFLDETSAAMRRRQWPAATTAPRLLHLQVEVDGWVIDLQVLDYPGEDFRGALRRLEKDRVAELTAHLAKSSVLLLLFDPQIDLAEPATHDDAEHQHQRMLAHLSALREVWRQSHGAGAEPLRDLGVLLTKMDRVEAVRTPAAAQRYFRGRSGGLADKLQKHASEVRYFAVSAVGATEAVAQGESTASIPAATLQPFGYEEVFRWILRRHRRLTKARMRNGVAAVLVLAAAVAAGWSGWRWSEFERQRAILADSNLSKLERLELSPPTESALLETRTKIFRDHLEEIAREIPTADGEARLASLRKELARLRNAHPSSLQGRLNELDGLVQQREESLLLNAVKQALDGNSATLPELARQFADRFPASPRLATVEKWRAQQRDRSQRDERDSIRLITVSNAATMASKERAIVEFLAKYGRDVEPATAAQMRRAAELAARFSQSNVYKAALRRSGGLSAARFQKVHVLVDGQIVREFATPTATTLANWEGHEFEFRWQSGMPVEAVLLTQSKTFLPNFSFYPVARQTDLGPLALRVLDARITASVEEGWGSAFIDGPPILEFTVAGFKPDDWQAAADYLSPGDKW